MPPFRPARPRRVMLALLAAGIAVATAAAPAVAAPSEPSEPPPGPLGALTEGAAAALVPTVQKVAGSALAGVWFVPDAAPGTDGADGTDGATAGEQSTGRLMVGTWEPALAPVLSALGATPVVRDGPPRDPTAALRLLTDRAAAGLPDHVAEFGVDEATQTLVVTVTGDGTAGEGGGLGDLLAGIDPSAVRVERAESAPRLQASIGGGDTIIGGGRRCTVGFTATDGTDDWLVTAGHCTRESSSWVTGPDTTTVGDDARTAPGGPDAGAVLVDDEMTATPLAGGTPVRGMRVAPVGGTVCLTGSTSGRLCGPVSRTNVVVNFGGQVQTGLTAADLCAREGDSGGPYLSPDGHAQGIHTGAGGPGCTSYFTPVGSAMGALDLTLRTG